MLRKKDTPSYLKRQFKSIFLMVGIAIIPVLPCRADTKEEIFMNIKTETRYKMTVIHFEIREGAIDDASEIEILRSNTMEGDYQTVGTLKYMAGQKSYEFQDKRLEKARHFYKLRVKGEDNTSKSFRGTASLVPRGT